MNVRVRSPLSLATTVALTALLMNGCAATPPATEAKPETAQTKPAAAAASAPAAATASSDMISYNVVRGDHLWGISGKPTIYGNPYQWPLIFKANRDKIKDADLIEPGQVFSIDKNPSSADIKAAVAHAKTRGEWKLGVTEQSDQNYLSTYAKK